LVERQVTAHEKLVGASLQDHVKRECVRKARSFVRSGRSSLARATGTYLTGFCCAHGRFQCLVKVARSMVGERVKVARFISAHRGLRNFLEKESCFRSVRVNAGRSWSPGCSA